ncbi:SEC10/PgrA surface exclusion domain-containing protein [Limosilactobacillus fastidiosus]|uniref:SEC10/PgrA surface exclusion domain-containing protein n=1 Tax=Limosilactobacillus fastidiosus TaxID=2759855 RepID=A0A7W3YCF9_9LACO|nr:SEC10/PgrA surface exclusion domain-containing protein [Limosilactobacillus fastidiosus]MBB1063289.1 SEC10/PgrA surface exclusion domain-containing protein [Limosilactobacillus fastidiosus]MBB1086071.1 SEC10/PgrA surface exclusion domain-containing protein [Limosilactobacillus fastidiosus]MCD7084599.1 SEC10/PgrA surface exclusion domain-containing protein [Limosilactobacillus fastidiosus]MCD7086290.1 SEC10/PgrA surface exclusion domain-containing protein [Limosilactobacillus fastidiosus]MCD
MSKTKKILTTTAAVAAATTGAMVATTAHADTTTTSAQAKQSSVSAQDQLNNMQAQHSQAESQMASANAAEMASATTDTNNQVAKLQDELKTNQASQAAEDAPKLASGTKAINQKAEEATAKENASYQQAVKDQQAANSEAIANASKNITTPLQKQGLTAQENQLYSQNTQKLDAEHQQKLDSLKSAYDENASQLNSQIQSQQTSEQQAHDQAIKDANAKLDRQIKDAQTSVDNLQQTVNNDQTEVTNAQNAVNQAQSQVQSATKALNDAKGASQTSSQGNLPDAEIDDNGVVQFDIWKDTNPADQRKATFDANGQLTGQDAIEINEFAANVLNEIRQQLGAPLLKVNTNSIKIASDSAKNYQLANSYWGGGHDYSILNRIQGKYNLSSFKESEIDGGHTGTTTTIADLKDQIYRELMEFINQDGDSNNAHKNHLLGIHGFTNQNYFGMNFTSDGSRYYTMSFNNPADATGNFSLATNPSSTPVDNTAALTSALNSAKTALSSANSHLSSAKTKLAHDTDSLNVAKTTLANLKSTTRPSDSADTDSPAVKALKGKLAALTSTYQANVKKENDAYNQAKMKLTKDHQARLNQIKNKPENVDDIKTANTKKLDELKKTHEANLAAIKADAEQQIAALKQQLADSHNDVNQPIIDKINALKAALAAKQDQLNQKLADLKANDAAAYAALRDKLMPKQVVTGTASGYLTAGGQVVSLSAKSGHSASSQAIALPQTGNNSSLAAAVLGAVSMMFSFGLMKKREM